jgi:hypothetical protein
MELTWLGKAEARGEARAVEQMRQIVLRSIEQRFGVVPEPVVARVQAIKTLEPLGNLLQELPLVQAAGDLLHRRRSRR